MPAVEVDRLADYAGQEVGVSGWLEITQERVDQFADVTEDHQFIHVDPERARETPFGGTIAHGFLTLSLLSWFSGQDTGMTVQGARMGINYGLNRVRFITPVRVGSAIRARYRFLGFVEKRPGQVLLSHEVTIEIQGIDTPAMVAETLVMAVL